MSVAIVCAIAAWLLMPEQRARLCESSRFTRMRDRRSAVFSLLRRSRAKSIQRAQAIRWLDALISELRAGRAPRSAVVLASESDDVCARARAAAALGGDVAQALRADATATRLSLLARVAACWSIGESAGAGLVAALEQVAHSARDEAEIRAEVAAQVAAPRATARLLAALPFAGVLLGTSMGASPVTWLLGSPLGWVDLAAGVSLAAVGLWWTGRMVHALERDLEASSG